MRSSKAKTYCFGSKEAMAEFMETLRQSRQGADYYSKKHPG